MTTIKTFIKRHALLSYYALTFAISWGAVLGMMGLTGLPTTKAQIEALLPVAILAMLLGPSASGLLMIGLVDGKAGFHELRARLGRWRVDIRWYAIALLLAPLLILAVLMALSVISPVYLPGLLTREDKIARLILMHTSLTAANIIYEPEALGGVSNFILDFVTAAAFWSIVAVLFMVTRKQLLRPKRVVA